MSRPGRRRNADDVDACRICGGLIDPSVEPPHPMAAAVEPDTVLGVGSGRDPRPVHHVGCIVKARKRAVVHATRPHARPW